MVDTADVLARLGAIADRHALAEPAAFLASLPAPGERPMLLVHPAERDGASGEGASVSAEAIDEIERWALAGGASSVRRASLAALLEAPHRSCSATAVVAVFRCGAPLYTDDLEALAQVHGGDGVPSLAIFTGAERLADEEELARIERGIGRNLGPLVGLPSTPSLQQVRAVLWAQGDVPSTLAPALDTARAVADAWLAEAVTADGSGADGLRAAAALGLVDDALRALEQGAAAEEPGEQPERQARAALAKAKHPLLVRLDDDTDVLLNELGAATVAVRRRLEDDACTQLVGRAEPAGGIDGLLRGAAASWTRRAETVLAEHVEARSRSIDHVLSGARVDWELVNRAVALAATGDAADGPYPDRFEVGSGAEVLVAADGALVSPPAQSVGAPAGSSSGRRIGLGVGGAALGYMFGLSLPGALLGLGAGLGAAELVDRAGSTGRRQEAEKAASALAAAFGERAERAVDTVGRGFRHARSEVERCFREVDDALRAAEEQGGGAPVGPSAELARAREEVEQIRAQLDGADGPEERGPGAEQEAAETRDHDQEGRI